MTWRSDDKVIEFGVSSAAQVWLKVKIDGRDGWIHTEEDLAAVGVPQAG